MRFINPQPAYYNSSGAPLANGKLNFYISGTTTRKDTYSDKALTTPNPNPVPLDGNGRPLYDIFLTNGEYKCVLTDSLDAEIWTKDPLGFTLVNPAIELSSLLLVLTNNLQYEESVQVLGYASQNDGGQSFWIATGTTNVGSAGSLDLANGFVYDAVGTQFLHADQEINVRSFGAKGDGVTDDTTAFGYALTYGSTSGKKVHIPPHDTGDYYKFDSTLSIPGSTTMYGASTANTTLRHTADGIKLVADAANIELRDFTIYNSSAGGLWVVQNSELICRNLNISSGKLIFQIGNTDKTHIDFIDCIIQPRTGECLTITTPGSAKFYNVNFINTIFSGANSPNSYAGINLSADTSLEGFNFYNSTFSELSTAIAANGAIGFSLYGVRFDSNTTDVSLGSSSTEWTIQSIVNYDSAKFTVSSARNYIVFPNTSWISLLALLDSTCPVGTRQDTFGGVGQYTVSQGWLPLSPAGTIGSASSGATVRANADTESLFTVLWDYNNDTNCPVSGGRGASAAADFAANKTITLPAAPGRFLAAVGSNGTNTYTNSETFGEDAHALTEAENGPHDHTYDRVVLNVNTHGTGATQNIPDNYSTETTSSSGSGDPHENRPSAIASTWYIRYLAPSQVLNFGG